MGDPSVSLVIFQIRSLKKGTKLLRADPAQLGGFLDRKSDGDPRVTHIWRGLKKFANLIEGAQIFQNTYG
jgi:hypothetical protein